MTEENNLSKRLLTLRLTEAERRAIAELGKIEGSESNAVRRAIKMLMEARGLDIPPDLFVDREAGNRLPKQRGKDRPVTKIKRTGRLNAVVGGRTPAAALQV